MPPLTSNVEMQNWSAYGRSGAAWADGFVKSKPPKESKRDAHDRLIYWINAAIDHNYDLGYNQGYNQGYDHGCQDNWEDDDIISRWTPPVPPRALSVIVALIFLALVAFAVAVRAHSEDAPPPAAAPSTTEEALPHQVAITFSLKLSDGSYKFVTGMRYTAKKFDDKAACDKFLDDQKSATTADETFKNSMPSAVQIARQILEQHPELIPRIECIPYKAPEAPKTEARE